MTTTIWIVITFLLGLLIGWLARSYLGDLFIEEFHELRKMYPPDEAVERANRFVTERQRYIFWGLAIFIASFLAVIAASYLQNSQTSQMSAAINNVDSNAGATKQGIADAVKQLGF